MQQKRSKKLREADNFRATVQRLQLHGESLRDWELDWLDSEARRHADYIYTDKERVILNQIAAATQTFEGYNGWPVAELITLAYQYRADLDLGDEEFIEQLNHRRPRTLPVRQLCRLVDIARLSEHIAKDQVVEDTLAQTRLRGRSSLRTFGLTKDGPPQRKGRRQSQIVSACGERFSSDVPNV